MSRPAAAAGSQRSGAGERAARSNRAGHGPSHADSRQGRPPNSKPAPVPQHPQPPHRAGGPESWATPASHPGVVKRAPGIWARQQRMAQVLTAVRPLLRTPSPPNTGGPSPQADAPPRDRAPSQHLCSPCRQLPRQKLEPGGAPPRPPAPGSGAPGPLEVRATPALRPRSQNPTTVRGDRPQARGSSSLSWREGVCCRPPGPPPLQPVGAGYPGTHLQTDAAGTGRVWLEVRGQLNVADQRVSYTRVAWLAGRAYSLVCRESAGHSEGRRLRCSQAAQHRVVSWGSSPAGTEITGHTHHPWGNGKPCEPPTPLRGFLPQVLPLMPPW